MFARDGGKCVICQSNAVDAHHILDRKLFPDGGYVEDNGASVCSTCHSSCETTLISVEELRKAAGITNVVLPPGFDPSKRYSKWGHEILPTGKVLDSPLFTGEKPRTNLGTI